MKVKVGMAKITYLPKSDKDGVHNWHGELATK